MHYRTRWLAMAKDRIHISGLEAVCDSASLLAHVLEEKVVVIEEDGQAIAVASPLELKPGRSFVETLALARLTTKE